MFWVLGEIDSTYELIKLFSFFFTHLLLLSSFWTSRGHRCRPFSPPVLAFNYYRAQGSSIPLLVDFSSSVADSCSRAFRKASFVHKKKSPRIYTSMHSGGFELTKLTYTRLEDNLIRHWGDRHKAKTLGKQMVGNLS